MTKKKDKRTNDIVRMAAEWAEQDNSLEWDARVSCTQWKEEWLETDSRDLNCVAESVYYSELAHLDKWNKR